MDVHVRRLLQGASEAMTKDSLLPELKVTIHPYHHHRIPARYQQKSV
jgi:hypothetical protein